MTREKQLHIVYMNIAIQISTLSRANRAKVGCIIVKDRRIVSCGYNGTPTGFNNICENEKGETKKEVIHAEANAILKVMDLKDLIDASLYITLSPCFECSKLIKQSGIKHVYFLEKYRDDCEGLKSLFIPYTHLKFINNELEA